VSCRRPESHKRIDAVAARLPVEGFLEFGELRRIGCREVMGFAEIFVDVIKLPCVAFEAAAKHVGDVFENLPGRITARGRHPAILVDGAIAKDFEILRGMRAPRSRIVETWQKALHLTFSGTIGPRRTPKPTRKPARPMSGAANANCGRAVAWTRPNEHRDQGQAKEEVGAPAQSAALGPDKSSVNAADAGDSAKKKRG
jgi:hypothetical protein